MTPPPALPDVEAFQFQDWTLQPALRQLSRAGLAAALGARAFDLLCHLVRHHHRVVTRD